MFLAGTLGDKMSGDAHIGVYIGTFSILVFFVILFFAALIMPHLWSMYWLYVPAIPVMGVAAFMVIDIIKTVF